MKNNLYNIFKQFIKFGIVGVSNTLISLGITYGIISLFHKFNLSSNETILVFLASFTGFIISVLNSYYWNNKYVFKKTNSKQLWPLLKSYICYGSTWLLSFALSFIFTNMLSISVVLVPAISMIITIPLNFIMNKFWTFK